MGRVGSGDSPRGIGQTDRIRQRIAVLRHHERDVACRPRKPGEADREHAGAEADHGGAQTTLCEIFLIDTMRSHHGLLFLVFPFFVPPFSI